MKVEVLSRRKAIAYCHEKHTRPVVMISISDPNMRYPSSPFVSRDNIIAAIVRLSFADADAQGKDVYGRDASSADLMQPEDGRKIKAALDAHPDMDVIVHCDAGISRSAGVGAGILKAMTGDDSPIYDSPMYRPNSHCYRTTLEALTSAREQPGPHME